jgi:acyl carrier protein
MISIKQSNALSIKFVVAIPWLSGIIPSLSTGKSNFAGKFYSRKTKDMTSEIISTLEGFITKEILKQPDRKIAADEALISGGLIDSFSLVDLALFVEENIGVRIDDTELNADTFDTLTQLAELIKSRQG